MSGSPPLRITSCTDVVGRNLVERRLPIGERPRALGIRKVPAEAVAAMDRARAGRHQQHAARRTFAAGPAAASRRASPTGSATKPGTSSSSSASGSTCRSSGSFGSPGRIRATKPRGTKSGNSRLAAPARRPRRPTRPAGPAAGTIRPDRGPRPASPPANVAYRGGAQVGRTTGSWADRIVTSIFSGRAGSRRLPGRLLASAAAPFLPHSLTLRTADTRGSA